MTMTEEKLKFLGLGTVVEVEDLIALKDIKYFVVVARAIGRNNDDSTLLRYMLAPHPFGDVPDQKENILRITASQIKKVIHEGYTDELDEKLLTDLESAMRGSVAHTPPSTKTEKSTSNNSEEEQKKAEELAQEQEKKAVEEEKIKIQEMLKKDPFYRFRKMKEAEANDRTN